MFGITAAFMAGLGWPTNVNATTDPPPKRGITMHLKIDGIGGDSKRKAYAGPIEVIAWSWSLTNPTCFGSRDFGRCGNVARVNLQDLTLTKFQDGATAGLLDAAATGRVFKQAVLTAVRNNSAGRPYMRIVLDNVRVTSVAIGGAGGSDRFTENVTLQYQTVRIQNASVKNDKTGPLSPPFVFRSPRAKAQK